MQLDGATSIRRNDGWSENEIVEYIMAISWSKNRKTFLNVLKQNWIFQNLAFKMYSSKSFFDQPHSRSNQVVTPMSARKKLVSVFKHAKLLDSLHSAVAINQKMFSPFTCFHTQLVWAFFHEVTKLNATSPWYCLGLSWITLKPALTILDTLGPILDTIRH